MVLTGRATQRCRWRLPAACFSHGVWVWSPYLEADPCCLERGCLAELDDVCAMFSAPRIREAWRPFSGWICNAASGSGCVRGCSSHSVACGYLKTWAWHPCILILIPQHLLLHLHGVRHGCRCWVQHCGMHSLRCMCHVRCSRCCMKGRHMVPVALHGMGMWRKVT